MHEPLWPLQHDALFFVNSTRTALANNPVATIGGHLSSAEAKLKHEYNLTS
jgi:hypothetical protein